MDSETTTDKPPEDAGQSKADKRRNNGRPSGTPTTESSTLCARVRAASGMTQDDFAREIDARPKTVWRYEKLSIVPKSGAKRAALERAARKFCVPIEETPA